MSTFYKYFLYRLIDAENPADVRHEVYTAYYYGLIDKKDRLREKVANAEMALFFGTIDRVQLRDLLDGDVVPEFDDEGFMLQL